MLKFAPNSQFRWSKLINVNWKELGSERIIKLVKEVGELKRARILLLSGNNIDDSAIAAIVALILDPEMPLERLDLSGNNITGEGAQQLLEAAKKKESLCELNLRANLEVGDKCIKEIESLMAEREKIHTSREKRHTSLSPS